MPQIEFLPLSGIQHFDFCKRQWALIHIEQLWEENILTFHGRQFHEKAHNPSQHETRGDRIITRGMHISSATLRLYGIADVVEFHRHSTGITLDRHEGYWFPYPIEYKLGKPKINDYDRLQLCAQAICLEEDYGIDIHQGAIFYGKTRRREEVIFTLDLRKKTKTLADVMHEMFRSGITPKAKYRKACDSCSLIELCLPKATSQRVDTYMSNMLK